MLKQYSLVYFLFIIIGACKQEERLNKFSIPKIIQLAQLDTVLHSTTQSINGVYPTFVDKYQFSKEIQIDFGKLWTNISNDTSKFEYINSYTFNHWDHSETDSLSIRGFHLKTDYNTEIGYKRYNEHDKDSKVFPVYIVNESQTPKVLLAKDGWVFAIQEAKNRKDIWQPIEEDGLDGCGNGYWKLKIQPGEFAIFLMNKYKGEFKTQLRVKLRIGKCNYISEPYEGNISEKQFMPFKYPN